jgi:formylglycine-generating enzyme required for sulfatase activity
VRITIELVAVPGGTLAMGSTLGEVERCVDEWAGRLIDPSYVPVFRSWIMKEFPQHPVDVPAFTARKYPVTNDEFREWLEHTGGPAPESIVERRPDDHPVWGVTLDEARAFAAWRAARDGRAWRLPTEAEWEWMAAGPEARRYPFGDLFDPARCNTTERGLGTTTAVDAHPGGVSWCGVMDLGGNVEEWTSSRYAPYPGGAFVDDELARQLGRDYPIVRGGSFALGGDLTRSARRHGPLPGPRFRVLGFRLVSDAAA